MASVSRRWLSGQSPYGCSPRPDLAERRHARVGGGTIRRGGQAASSARRSPRELRSPRSFVSRLVGRGIGHGRCGGVLCCRDTCGVRVSRHPWRNYDGRCYAPSHHDRPPPHVRLGAGGRDPMTDRLAVALAVVTMSAMFAVGVASGIAIDHRLLHQPRRERAYGDMPARHGDRPGPPNRPMRTPGRALAPNGLGRDRSAPSTRSHATSTSRQRSVAPPTLSSARSSRP